MEREAKVYLMISENKVAIFPSESADPWYLEVRWPQVKKRSTKTTWSTKKQQECEAR
jgi:hypothetical protein